MADKFDLKAAATLLRVVDNSKDTSVRQLIDAIELYDSLFNADGKKLLTAYVL